MWFRSSPPFTFIEIIDQKEFILVLLLSVVVPYFLTPRTCRVWIIMAHHIFMTASDWMLHTMNISRQLLHVKKKKITPRKSKHFVWKLLKKEKHKNPSNIFFFFLPNDFCFDFSAILLYLLPFSNNLLFFSLFQQQKIEKFCDEKLFYVHDLCAFK